MAEIRKKFTEWEKQVGVIVTGASKKLQNSNITLDEFLAQQAKHPFTGVDHAARTAFLKANGHAVTRENMTNSDLAAKPSEDSVE